jgi:uncharacterized membrane protein
MSTPERWASRVLQVGGVAAVAVMTLGLIGTAATTQHGAHAITSIGQLRAVLAAHPADPNGICVVGFLMLCLTPLAAVLSAAIAFSREHDRRFTIVAALVGTGILLGLLLGAA